MYVVDFSLVFKKKEDPKARISFILVRFSRFQSFVYTDFSVKIIPY